MTDVSPSRLRGIEITGPWGEESRATLMMSNPFLYVCGHKERNATGMGKSTAIDGTKLAATDRRWVFLAKVEEEHGAEQTAGLRTPTGPCYFTPPWLSSRGEVRTW